MVKGYSGKLLDVNLSTESVRELSIEEVVLKNYIGGRGLAAKILWDDLGERWEEIDPLGRENLLLFLTGPLTGFFPGSKICISGKSPLTNGIIGSTVAGEFAVELKCSGYDGLVVRGKANSPVYLFVKDSEVEIRDAAHIWGEGGRRTLETLANELKSELDAKYPNYGRWKEPSILYIGPAGENRVRFASIMAKWSHAAGRGGYGAVMGSKNLKAVAVKGTGPLPEVKDLEAVEELRKQVVGKCLEMERFRRWGTGAGGYEFGFVYSSEPVRNWQEEWHDNREFGVDKFEQRLWVKHFWGDFGCPLTCLKISVVKSGPFKGSIADNPDYEMQACVGTNLGVFSPEGNVYLTSIIDDLGLDGISAGGVLGFAAELHQRGILRLEQLDGIDLKWGDERAFSELARKIAFREGIGDVLAEGTYRAALKIGEEALKYAVQVKGLEIGAHGIRSGLDYPDTISYACSTQAGDHTSIAYHPPDSPSGEFYSALEDSAVICSFISFGIERDVIWRFFKATTDFNLDDEKWCGEIGRRIIHIQRVALLLGGPDVSWNPVLDDENPPRFYEPLPNGPRRGRAVNREELLDLRKKYYEKIGWDEMGFPREEELERLGLDFLKPVLGKIKAKHGFLSEA